MPVPATHDNAGLVLDRFDAYRVALEFVSLASKVKARTATLRDQLDRAAASIPLNVAEGVGRATAADQARFFAIARGSSLECVVIWDVLRAQGVLSAELHAAGRQLLAREVAMLTRLIRPVTRS